MGRISGDILRGHIDTVVLAALEAREAYGYEIMQRLNSEGKGVFAMKEGTLYPVLYRLEDKGWLATRWESEDVPRKGPRRRLYRLTAKGKKQLAKYRNEWRQFVHVMGRIVEA
ncbi:MAG: helix-turn-helix transcriptional regulator [Candidatus Hydrogenedentes bacterium]|nr:helix-turn-helix transcriptional regulator [Candidatus Hydrogenedentota bacterium]